MVFSMKDREYCSQSPKNERKIWAVEDVVLVVDGGVVDLSLTRMCPAGSKKDTLELLSFDCSKT